MIDIEMEIEVENAKMMLETAQGDDSDVPEYNRVSNDDSIAVKNAKLAAQQKARDAQSAARTSSTASSNTTTSTSSGSSNNSSSTSSSGNNNTSDSILWKNRNKAY